MAYVLEYSDVVLEYSDVVLEYSGSVLEYGGVVLEYGGSVLEYGGGDSSTEAVYSSTEAMYSSTFVGDLSLFAGDSSVISLLFSCLWLFGWSGLFVLGAGGHVANGLRPRVRDRSGNPTGDEAKRRRRGIAADSPTPARGHAQAIFFLFIFLREGIVREGERFFAPTYCL
jgi:hypothetical protein